MEDEDTPSVIPEWMPDPDDDEYDRLELFNPHFDWKDLGLGSGHRAIPTVD